MPGQRAAITLEFTELVERLRAEARERSGARTDLTSCPIGQEVANGGTRKALAEKAGVGSGSIQRLTEVQRDNPELFAEVKDREIFR